MSTYANSTEVNPARTREEIERTLTRFGASSFGYGWDMNSAMIGFTVRNRQIRFYLPMPDKDDKKYWRTETGRARAKNAAYTAWEQDCRARWRALALVIKAKLSAVETGITSFEEEFALHTVLPDGRLAKEHVMPAIDTALESGSVPPMLALEK